MLETTFSIHGDHPALAGHFPNNPVIPGVVILDEVISAFDISRPDLEVCSIKNVKFLSPLKADMLVTIRLEDKGNSIINFLCLCDNSTVVKGQFKVFKKA